MPTISPWSRWHSLQKTSPGCCWASPFSGSCARGAARPAEFLLLAVTCCSGRLEFLLSPGLGPFPPQQLKKNSEHSTQFSPCSYSVSFMLHSNRNGNKVILWNKHFRKLESLIPINGYGNTEGREKLYQKNNLRKKTRGV